MPLKVPAAAFGLRLADDQKPVSPEPAKRVKIVHVINDLSIGGAEMMLYKLLSECNRERFEPVVISLVDRGPLRERIEAQGIAVHSTGIKFGLPSPLGLWRLVRLLRRLKPDLVLGWMYHSCFAAQLANFFLKQKIPVLWGIHYSISSLAGEKMVTAAVIKLCAFLSKFAAHVIFVSPASQAKHRLLGYHLEKSCVIPNGINVTEFVPSRAARASVRTELRLSKETILIGLMARYHPAKDHETFLRAASLISKLHPEIHFLLIGRGVDQKSSLLPRMIKELGLERQVHLMGERHDIPRLAASLDVFSLSSAYGESFPNVIGEAMACEVCPVVTEVGDAVWIVGEAGRVVSPRDPVALAAGWEEMIDLGLEGRAALGRQARARVAEHFTIESVVERYDLVYEQVLAQGLGNWAAAPARARLSTLNARFDDTGVN